MKHADGGFTLIELMIALSVFTVLAVSFVTALRQALDSWHRQSEQRRQHQAAVAVMGRLARELRNAIPIGAEGLTGTARELCFYHPEGERIVRCVYHLSDEAGGKCVLHFQKQFVSRGVEDAFASDSHFDLEGSLQWDFAAPAPGGGILWKPEWTDARRFPLGVRVQMKFLTEGGPPVAYRRILDLPRGGQ
jgi:prepilin-type N-terminal cleavage/methylation domain-containing protein